MNTIKSFCYHCLKYVLFAVNGDTKTVGPLLNTVVDDKHIVVMIRVSFLKRTGAAFFRARQLKNRATQSRSKRRTNTRWHWRRTSIHTQAKRPYAIGVVEYGVTNVILHTPMFVNKIIALRLYGNHGDVKTNDFRTGMKCPREKTRTCKWINRKLGCETKAIKIIIIIKWIYITSQCFLSIKALSKSWCKPICV